MDLLIDVAEKFNNTGPLNLGTGTETSIKELVNTIVDIIGYDGDIIWNTTEGVLQVYLGNIWENISTPSTSGLSATGSVGTVQVVTNGNIVVAL